jgi:hypothetical protein
MSSLMVHCFIRCVIKIILSLYAERFMKAMHKIALVSCLSYSLSQRTPHLSYTHVHTFIRAFIHTHIHWCHLMVVFLSQAANLTALVVFAVIHECTQLLKHGL